MIVYLLRTPGTRRLSETAMPSLEVANHAIEIYANSTGIPISRIKAVPVHILLYNKKTRSVVDTKPFPSKDAAHKFGLALAQAQGLSPMTYRVIVKELKDFT